MDMYYMANLALYSDLNYIMGGYEKVNGHWIKEKIDFKRKNIKVVRKCKIGGDILEEDRTCYGSTKR